MSAPTKHFDGTGVTTADASTSKARVIFLDKKEDAKPLRPDSPVLDILTKEDTSSYQGPIKPNGEINWNCPCMAGMVSGPCGSQFRQAFSCFHYSEMDPKGSDCLDKFMAMRECFDKYPNVYPVAGKDDEEGEDPFVNSQEAEEENHHANRRTLMSEQQ